MNYRIACEIICFASFFLVVSVSRLFETFDYYYYCCYIPRGNGAKRRSGRKPGARVTNLALAIAKFKVSIGDRR